MPTAPASSLRKTLPWMIVAALLAGGGWWVSTLTRVEVLVAEAVRGSAVDAVTGTIKVLAAMDLQLKTEVPGRVKQVPVELGQAVRQGEVVMVLESSDLELQLRQRQVQLAAARGRLALPYAQAADLATAEEELENLRLSIARGMAPEAELQRRQREVDKLRAWLEGERINRQEAVHLLEYQVQQLELGLSRMVLKAPFDGIVVEILAFPGDWLWAGGAVARLITTDRSVELTLSEEDYHGVEKGQSAALHLASYPGQTIAAKVEYLALFANSDRKTRALYLKAEGDQARLIPGLTGEAVLIKAERADTVIIPRRGLIGDRVYVVGNGRVEERQVKPGFLGLNKAEVREGLAPGEAVVLENQSLLRAGQPVRTRPASPTP